jgi:hypothetical protein
MNKELLKGFDFISYLHRRFLLGQVDPWRKTDDGKPIYTLLCSVETALDECKEWSGQEIGRTELVDYLKINDIYIFKNIEEFVHLKDKLHDDPQGKATSKKRNISEETKEKLRQRMKKLNVEKHKKFTVSQKMAA